MNPYDLCLKEVFSNKQHFADLFSTVYFKKGLLLDPDKLSLYDKETHHDLGFRKENDLLMFYDNKFFLHLEFQRKKDPYMPVRILNYKYAGIHQQIKTDTKLHLLYPVYSLTLYMGESKWEHRKRLYECMVDNQWNAKEIPDYQMELFDINSDPIDFMCLYLQKFFRIIQYVYQKKWENLYTDSLLENVEEDIFYHANVFVNLNQEFIQKHTKEGVISMCKALEEYTQECIEKGERRGERKGIIKGEQRGYSKGLTNKAYEIAQNMLSKGCQHNFIADMTGLSLDTVLKLSNH
ncbi:Rpn family recombination-promoting nuclease/putative transposase [Faecalicoccus pleomorphus]